MQHKNWFNRTNFHSIHEDLIVTGIVFPDILNSRVLHESLYNKILMDDNIHYIYRFMIQDNIGVIEIHD